MNVPHKILLPFHIKERRNRLRPSLNILLALPHGCLLARHLPCRWIIIRSVTTFRIATNQQCALYLTAQSIAHDNTLNAIDLLSVLKKDQGGDTFNSILVNKLFIAIHVYLSKGYSSLIFLTNRSKLRLKDLAGTAPGRGKIDDRHLRGLQHLFCKILVAYSGIAGCRICHSVVSSSNKLPISFPHLQSKPITPLLPLSSLPHCIILEEASLRRRSAAPRRLRSHSDTPVRSGKAGDSPRTPDRGCRVSQSNRSRLCSHPLWGEEFCPGAGLPPGESQRCRKPE